MNDIIVAIINGLFIVVSTYLGVSLYSKKKQMNNYSKELEKKEIELRNCKSILEHTFSSYINNRGYSGSWFESYITQQNIYCSKIAEYNALITEINLLCNSTIKPKFFYPRFNEKAETPETGINYES